MGLAWSSQGGNMLYIEAASVERGENKGALISTGKASLAPFFFIVRGLYYVFSHVLELLVKSIQASFSSRYLDLKNKSNAL